jgi:transcriptional regulator with XRE-family HTH domain
MRPVRRYCGCGNPLARDNAASICAACRDRRESVRAPRVPPEFWRTDVMATALASGDLGRMLRAYRSHPSHGHRPLPQTVLAVWLSVSQMTVSRIEQGKRRLTIDEINWFAGSLGIPMTLRWVAHHEAKEDVDPFSRRSLLGAGVGAAFGLNATTAPAAAREIDPALVDHWMKLLRVLDHHDAMFGPHDVVATVRHQIGMIAEYRRIARGEVRTQLLRVEARWSGFASWLSVDAGNSQMHDYWADRAVRLAREAGYDDMVAWMRMRQSQWAIRQRDSRQAIAFAESGHGTLGAKEQIRAMCALREAHGHALANDATSCERRLAETHALLDEARGEDDPAWKGLGQYGASRPYVLAGEARCWLRLRPAKAIAMFEDALRAWPRDRTRGRGIHQSRLALACAAAGEPERAAAEGLAALDIAQTTRSVLTMQELTRLDRRLAACDAPAATDFREAFATL